MFCSSLKALVTRASTVNALRSISPFAPLTWSNVDRMIGSKVSPLR